MPGSRRPLHALAAVGLLLVCAALVGEWPGRDSGGPAGGDAPAGGSAPPAAPPALEPAAGDDAIERAFRARRSDLWVEVAGTVTRSLPDDLEGSRHQRFILQLASGHTLLVAHNLELADRVPLRAGDALRLRGQYEWNQRGGVVHWTHHDPGGRRPGGWIEHDGQRYR